MSKTTRLMEGESISDGKLHIRESYTFQPVVITEGMQKIVTEAKEGNKKSVLKPRIEAIHAGRTRNNNIYPSEKLRGDRTFKDSNGNIIPTGVHSFTMPYPKPMVIDHYPTADNCTGRITNAQFVKDAVSGKEMIVIIPEITSEDAIQKVMDGRYLTVSVGSTTDSAICNICGKDIIKEGWCEHEKGETYDGVICGWIVGNLWFDECSWVAVPADTAAKVTNPGEVATMEAYMEVGNEFYSLSGNQTSTLTESAASTLGLVGSKEQPKGGLGTMTEEEKALAEQEGGTGTPVVEEVPTEPTPGVQEETPPAIPSEEPDVAEQLAAKDAIITEKDNQISILTADKTGLEEQIATLNAQVEELQTEKQTLITQAAEMVAGIHKDLVERVVDLKIALGKPGVENREEAVAEHMARAEQSLSDSYIDLFSELKTGKKQYVPESVQRPGVGAIPGEENTTIEGTTISAPAVKDTRDVVKSLLTGDYRINK